MIKSVEIKNFKSVVDVSLGLGTFNILIGENGCGKSNILEAIAFGAAASADKLDYEFLGSRGIRVTNPEFMFSAFTNGKENKSITLNFATDEQAYSYQIENETNNPKKWINKNKKRITEEIEVILDAIYMEDDELRVKQILSVLEDNIFPDSISENIKQYTNKKDYKKIVSLLSQAILKGFLSDNTVSDYIVYSPEQSSLRKFEDTAQLLPLGIRGEGLFQHLKELAFDKKNTETLDSIKNNMFLLDWYENFDLPENLMKNEFALRIKDKYLYNELQYFDQRSTNEGFLFLLFYSTLFISKATPKFFAIDNIDVSLNPKLCMQLTKNLSGLAEKYGKQVIITTQNPAVLDGLDLKDDNQRLFVVRRNDDGYSKAERIEYKSERRMKLSEVWTSGFIGGLPENF